MVFYFVQINQINGDKTLFKFDSLQKAVNFMWTLKAALFTEHVMITLLSEEDI